MYDPHNHTFFLILQFSMNIFLNAIFGITHTFYFLLDSSKINTFYKTYLIKNIKENYNDTEIFIVVH